VKFAISLKVGEQAVLTATDGENEVVVKSSEVCETSIKNPATEEIIKEQLGKLGSTIYELEKLDIASDENVFLRKSTLNQLRREATELLYEKGAVVYSRKEAGNIPLSRVFDFEKNKNDARAKISLKINHNNEIEFIDNMKVKRVYVPYNLDMEMAKTIEVEEKYLWIPNIVSKSEYALFDKNMKIYEGIFDGVCVNNPGSFYFFKENSNLKIHCGPFFNIINSFSAELLKGKGADSITFSIEANIRDMESIVRNSTLRTEIVSHAYAQLMVMKNCPMSMIKNCKNLQDCSKCEYRERFMLKDRKGAYFNIERENKLTHIYNSVPLTLIGKVFDFERAGIEFFFVDTKYLEDPEEIIDAMYCEINGVQTSNVLQENGFTRGHYLKNIL
jgi:putative protease